MTPRPTQSRPSVPRLWPGETVVCIGTGPSLTQADVDFCRGRARVIAVNNAYRLALWAEALYAADDKWWGWEKGAPDFAGLKYSIAPMRRAWPGVVALRNTGQHGLELDPTGLRTGFNSGYQAINLAVHFGAARVVLLGYDFQGDHFFGSHPDKTRPPFPACLRAFATLSAPLAAAGVTIVNATRQTALLAFPRVPLEQLIAEVAA